MRIFSTVCLLLSFCGCSDNFGAPPLAGNRVPTRSRGAIGPVVPRTPVGISGGGRTVVVGTDRSIYRVRVDGGVARWSSEHPGFVAETGEASPQFVQALEGNPDAGLYLHNTAVGGGQADHFLFGSSDGGVRYASLGRPDPLERGIDHIAVVTPGARFPSGGFLAVQDLALWAREVNGVSWNSVALPGTGISIDALASLGGEIVLGVQTAAGAELWKSIPDSLELRPVPTLDRGPWMAVGLAADGTPSGLTPTAVVVGEEVYPLPIGWAARSGRFALGGRLAILATDAISGGLFFVQLGEPVGSPTRLPEPVAEFAPLYDGETTWLITSGSALLRHDESGFKRFEFEGPDSWWTALSADTRSGGGVALGNRLTGSVFRAATGEGWEDLGAGLRNSTARMIALDERSATGLWLGSFGLYLYREGLGWEQRTSGMLTYLQTQTLELMEMSTLATDPLDPTHLWCGTTEGNGPYESVNGGQSWVRRHDGLGIAGSVVGEDGLPNATQVRRFVFGGERTWMATFRGGVWELQPGPSWRQVNQGLPDLNGAPLDRCCFEPLEAEVDVRDLLRLEDGSLLAATGWGIYLDEGAKGRWVESSTGLSNSNVVSLARHPDQPDWILAAARGSFLLADWLFLSTDGGRQWRPVDTGRPYAPALDAVWSNPSRLEVVAILEGLGAWSVELMP